MGTKRLKFDLENTSEAARRRDVRRSVYRSEGIRVRLLVNGEAIAADVLDLGSEGGGVFVETDIAHSRLIVGAAVSLTLTLNGQAGKPMEGIIVNSAVTSLAGKNGIRLGIAYLAARREPGFSDEERGVERFPCWSYFAPTAYCENPLFFQETIFFQVADFSASGGKLTTSSRNQSLMVGMSLYLTISIPMAGEFQVPADIIFVRPAAVKDRLEVGVQFTEVSQQFLAGISEYLFASTDCSLERLRKAGLPVDQIEKGLTFGYPTSSDDWREILQLRFRAYTAVGKFADAKVPNDMLDDFDRHARQIICKVHGKIIACARVVFVNGDREKSEHHRLGVAVPEWLWNKPFCEVSRACTAVDYRGSDVFFNLLRHTGRIAYQSGCRYILANCNDNLWPMYRSTGFNKLGVTFSAFSAGRCHLIVANLDDMFSGRSGRLVGWNQVTYPMARFLTERVNPRLLPAWRARLHKLLFPLLRIFRRMRKKPRARPKSPPA